MVAAAVATLAPWALRNARALGEPVWTTTHGGYTLALANNPTYYDEVLDGPPGAVWSGPNQRRWWDADQPRDGRPDRAPGRPPLRLRAADAGRAAARLRPGLAGAAGTVLGRGPLGGRLSAGSACHGRVDRPALGRPGVGLSCTRFWPGRGSSPRSCCRPLGGPRGLLDRPADAGTARAGHRPDRGRRRAGLAEAPGMATARGPDHRREKTGKKIEKFPRILLFKSGRNVRLKDSRSRRVSIS